MQENNFTSENKAEKSEKVRREEETLKFWEERKIFQKSLEKSAPNGEFVFYDGPATANAQPVLHTMEPFAFKDVMPRYKTMRGFHVARKVGWDTHGLPVELQIEKKLGFQSKKDIEAYGIEKFNALCRESVWEFIGLWKDYTKRIGYWADQDHPYITYDNSYIESVWNIVKTINDKGYLYKDYKVLPWCPRCGTALSSHELAQGYQDDKDLAVTAKFKVKSGQKIGSDFVADENTYLLAWTTTPWTLPGNVALAVGENIEYVKVQVDKVIGTDALTFAQVANEGKTPPVITKLSQEIVILAKNRFESLRDLTKNDGYEFKILDPIQDADLVGLEYEPLYPYLAQKFSEKDPDSFEKAYKVYAADFVNTEDGTGIVHTAVMYGQDDFVLGSEVGLPKFHLVDDAGHFADGMDFLSGRFVKDEEVAVDIIKDLAHRGLLFKKEKHEHSYPHCWRCKTPLIYYARDSWYVSMSKLRSELIAENEKINWQPEYIKEGRFGEWLKEAKDWAVSRERYWGTPLPVWVDREGKYRVIGSLDEFKKLSKKSGNRYFIMRHGETEGNVRTVWSLDDHHADPLTEKGKEEVKAWARKIQDQKIDLIIASPFSRTRETAEMVAAELGLSADTIVTDPRLGEWNVGVEFDGKSIEDFFAVRNASANRYEFKTHDGESYAEVMRRSGEFLYDMEKQYANKNILIVSHGAPTRAMSLVAAGYSFNRMIDQTRDFANFANAEIREVEFSPLPHNANYELDLHRPYIDTVELVDEHGQPLTRAKEVMDVWFDSGSMPFAQAHYPWNTGELLYPADYISEAIDQTRGWFYVLLCIGVLMGRGTPYKNVISLGHILDAKGKKMSKSIGNVINPWDMLDRYGADALRLWMYTVNQPGDSKNFDEKSVDEVVKKVFNLTENILSFYELYKDKTVHPVDDSAHILDRWIIARLNLLIEEGTRSLDTFGIFEAARAIREFVNDFSTWYIRRSRERFKSHDAADRSAALATTRFVLREFAKYMAPFTPFFAEHVYQNVRTDEDAESVHLSDWPEAKDISVDLLEQMKKTREIVSAVLEERNVHGIRVRQPLASLVLQDELSEGLRSILAEEVNVKEVVSDPSLATAFELDRKVTPELLAEGQVRDLIRAIQDARKAASLAPQDTMVISVDTDDVGRSFVETHADAIKKTTNIGGFLFEKNDGVALETGGLQFKVSLQ